MTTRHLAEFWMIEPEIAFCDLEGDMKCAEEYVQFCLKYVLANCMEDLKFFESRIDEDCIKRCEKVATTPFVRLSYTDAVTLLMEHEANGKFKRGEETDELVYWGIDFRSEHERYLCEQVYMGPTILYDYPVEIKAFYMRLNDDRKTVAAMDVLVPKIGELVGGSQREERADELELRIAANGLDAEEYKWYMDLRNYGGVPHSGFGLGFERLVLFVTGLENIRDVNPFPRYYGKIL